MNLSDSEILKLNDLCNAVIDGALSETQKQELSRWLINSEEAREYYVRMTGLSASLFHYAGEMQTGEPDAVPAPRRWRWVIGLFSIAACIAAVLWIRPQPNPAPPESAAAPEIEFVAQLTGGKDFVWASGSPAIQPRDRLKKGQRLELAKGFAEITFDSGAQVLLQGPASLDVNSAWSAMLHSGKLTASLPPEAAGFSISNQSVKVVDIGTEFTMVADTGDAATEVLVLKGEVEAAPWSPQEQDQEPIVLREKEARRFASSGVSGVRDSDAKFAQFRQPVALERYVSPVGYAHWSFDHPSGSIYHAQSFGLAQSAGDAELVSEALSLSRYAEGHLGAALRFSGDAYAQTTFPGISENSPHTVLFWVKVPKDAHASNAYAMAAWSVKNTQLGSHPVHITWNRNANEGAWGVLRTDYGGGNAIGSTPLRDGQWHHIAVVFIPREDPASPVECKQYVDGRLDGEGKPSTPGSGIFTRGGDNWQTANNTIWLGCRLGTTSVVNARFAGDMDELFVTDCALSPPEIVRLMNTNRVDE